MNIIFVILWNIIIEYRFHIIHIDTSRCNISCDQDLCFSGTETAHHTVTLCLLHISVQSLSKISASLQFLSKFIHHTFCITEHQREFWIIIIKESGQNFYLVFSLYIIVILLNIRNGQLFFYHFDRHGIVLVFLRDI